MQQCPPHTQLMHVPQQHPGPVAPPPPAAQGGQGAQTVAGATLLDSKLDHMSQCRLLTDKLKQVLAETMRAAAAAITHSVRVQTGSLKVAEPGTHELERSFEKCFSLCDLIEHNLRTTLQCSHQTMCSQRFTPLPVGVKRPDAPQAPLEPLSYNQYVGTVRCQIQAAEEVRSMLLEAAQMTSTSHVSADPQTH